MDDLDYFDEIYHLLPNPPTNYKWIKIKDDIDNEKNQWKLQPIIDIKKNNIENNLKNDEKDEKDEKLNEKDEIDDEKLIKNDIHKKNYKIINDTNNKMVENDINYNDNEKNNEDIDNKLLKIRILEYLVENTDTIQGISLKFNVKINDIKRLNHLSSNSLFKKKIILLLHGKLSDLYQKNESSSSNSSLPSSTTSTISNSNSSPLSISIPNSSISYYPTKLSLKQQNNGNYFNNLSERCIGISCTDCYSSSSPSSLSTSSLSTSFSSQSLSSSSSIFSTSKNDLLYYLPSLTSFSSSSGSFSPSISKSFKSNKIKLENFNENDKEIEQNFLINENYIENLDCSNNNSNMHGEESMSVPLLFK